MVNIIHNDNNHKFDNALAVFTEINGAVSEAPQSGFVRSASFSDQPKSCSGSAISGRGFAAVSAAQKRHGQVPSAPSGHEPAAIQRREARIGLNELSAPAVLCPLHHVAVHVVNTPSVGHKTAHRGSVSKSILATLSRPAGVFLKQGRIGAIGMGAHTRRARCPRVGRLSARSGGIFPLMFARQAVILACFSTQPLGKSLRICRTDADHRMVIGLRKAWVFPSQMCGQNIAVAIPRQTP